MLNNSMTNGTNWKHAVGGMLLTALMGIFFAFGMSVFFIIGLAALTGKWADALIHSVVRLRNNRVQP